MARVITFSTKFPAYHPKAGQPTGFPEKVVASLGGNPAGKGHTIRAGHRFGAGDHFSPRVWSGAPYRSKQRILAPDVRIASVVRFYIQDGDVFVDGKLWDVADLSVIAKNDGLTIEEFLAWFKFPANFDGQIIIWNEKIKY